MNEFLDPIIKTIKECCLDHKFLSKITLKFLESQEEVEYKLRILKISKFINFSINFFLMLSLPLDIILFCVVGFPIRGFVTCLGIKVFTFMASYYLCGVCKHQNNSKLTRMIITLCIYGICRWGYLGNLNSNTDQTYLIFFMFFYCLHSHTENWIASVFILLCFEIVYILADNRSPILSLAIIIPYAMLNYCTHRINRRSFYNERKREKSLESFKNIIHHQVRIGIWVYKPIKNKCSFENRKGFEILNQSRFTKNTELIQSKIPDLTSIENKKYEIEIKLANSEEKTYYFCTVQKLVKNGLCYFVITFTDITDLKKLQLNYERVSEAKDSVIESVSHDIRTPLNSIISMNQSVLDEIDDDSQKIKLVIALKSSKLLLYLMTDFLDFYKMNSDTAININLTKFVLKESINDIIELFFINCHNKGLQLNVNITINPEVELYSDELKFKRILINLISNALKYTERGEIFLEVKKKNINGIKLIKFSVIDTGVGIKEEDLKFIFQKYKQISQGNFGSSNLKQHGIGLGLSISNEMVNLLLKDYDIPQNKKYLNVKSEYGKGSKFSFLIPFQFNCLTTFIKPDKDSCFDRREENLKSLEIVQNINYMEQYMDKDYISFVKNIKNSISSSNHKSSPYLMVVEDEETNILVMQMYFDKITKNVIFARNGYDAFLKYREFCEKDILIPLIFMDLNMPIMDGYKATAEIRNFEISTKRSNAIIIALTANVMNDNKHYKEHGFDKYEKKPISYLSVCEILKDYDFMK